MMFMSYMALNSIYFYLEILRVFILVYYLTGFEMSTFNHYDHKELSTVKHRMPAFKRSEKCGGLRPVMAAR